DDEILPMISHPIHVDRVEIDEVELRRRALAIEHPRVGDDGDGCGGLLIQVLARRDDPLARTADDQRRYAGDEQCTHDLPFSSLFELEGSGSYVRMMPG